MLEQVMTELKAYLKEGYEYVRAHAREVPLREREMCRAETQSGRTTIQSDPLVLPDYAIFIGRESTALCNLASFQPLNQSLIPNPSLWHALRLADDPKMALDDLFHYYLAPLLSNLLSEVDAGRPYEEVLQSSLDSLSSFISKDTYPMRYTAPLLNLTCDRDELEVIDGIFLRRVPNSDLESYFASMRGIANIFDRSVVEEVEFQLEVNTSCPRSTLRCAAATHQVENIFRKIEKAFRLLKRGAVGILLSRGQSFYFLGPGESRTGFPSTFRVHGEPSLKYAFAHPEVEDIKATLPQLERLDGDPRFELAMRRFMDAYHKPMAGDRLIDYWIALESLILPDGKEGELRYRAALRLAHLLEVPGKRFETYAKAMKSYKHRSRVVHGTIHAVDVATVADTEDLLRGALRRCLQLGEVPNSKWLNQLVLNQKQD